LFVRHMGVNLGGGDIGVADILVLSR